VSFAGAYPANLAKFSYVPVVVAREYVVAMTFPMVYLEKPVSAQELISKEEGFAVTRASASLPEHLVKSGKVAELRSKFA